MWSRDSNIPDKSFRNGNGMIWKYGSLNQNSGTCSGNRKNSASRSENRKNSASRSGNRKNSRTRSGTQNMFRKLLKFWNKQVKETGKHSGTCSGNRKISVMHLETEQKFTNYS